MNTHRALIQGTFRRTSLILGLAATLLSGCKSYYMWDHPWIGMDSGACGCESSTVISRSSPIGSERISPVPVVSEPPLATGTTLKSIPSSSQGPVLTPAPTQVPLNSSSGK